MPDSNPPSNKNQLNLQRPFHGLAPRDLFEQLVDLGRGEEGRAMKTLVERHCLRHGYRAFIDEYEDGSWVFYKVVSVTDQSQGLIRVDFLDYFVDKHFNALCASEKAMEEALARAIERVGYYPVRQFETLAGIVDVKAMDVFFELKRELSRPAFQQAVGQLLLYSRGRMAHRLFVIGRDIGALDRANIEAARLCGVDVIFWPDDRHKEYPGRPLEDRIKRIAQQYVTRQEQQKELEMRRRNRLESRRFRRNSQRARQNNDDD